MSASSERNARFWPDLSAPGLQISRPWHGDVEGLPFPQNAQMLLVSTSNASQTPLGLPDRRPAAMSGMRCVAGLRAMDEGGACMDRREHRQAEAAGPECGNRSGAVSLWRTDGVLPEKCVYRLHAARSGENIVLRLARQGVGDRWESVESGGYRCKEAAGDGGGRVWRWKWGGRTRGPKRVDVAWGAPEPPVALGCCCHKEHRRQRDFHFRVIAPRKSRRTAEFSGKKRNSNRGRYPWLYPVCQEQFPRMMEESRGDRPIAVRCIPLSGTQGRPA